VHPSTFTGFPSDFPPKGFIASMFLLMTEKTKRDAFHIITLQGGSAAFMGNHNIDNVFNWHLATRATRLQAYPNL
jgi:hypothetical protein